eukprot:g41114.t1
MQTAILLISFSVEFSSKLMADAKRKRTNGKEGKPSSVDAIFDTLLKASSSDKGKGALSSEGKEQAERGVAERKLQDGKEESDNDSSEDFWNRVDSRGAEVLRDSRFTELPRAAVKQVLERDTLNAKEMEVAGALLRWAEGQKQGIKGAERRELLRDLLPSLRFPCLTTREFAQLTPEELLDSATSIQLFIYLSKAQKEGAKPGSLPLPEALKGFNAKKRSYKEPWRLRFDADSGRNCAVSNEGLVATRQSSYESTIRGDSALPEFPVSIKLRLSQETSWSGALVIGAIAKHEPVSQTVYGAPAYYLDLWHSQVRTRGASTSITCNTEDIKRPGVTLEMCMDWLPEHGKDSNTSSNLGGVLKFSLNGEAIPQADLTIPADHQPGTLLPWFGVYGRTQSIECVEVEP